MNEQQRSELVKVVMDEFYSDGTTFAKYSSARNFLEEFVDVIIAIENGETTFSTVIKNYSE